MSIFKEINDNSKPEELEEQLLEQELLENIQELEEKVDTSSMNLDQLAKGFDAAKRGLGLANKLKNPADKKKHLSRIMGNMNKLRAALKRMHDSIDVEAA